MYSLILALGTPTTASDGAAAGGSMVTTLITFAVIILIFYFLIIRPQRKRDKEAKAKIVGYLDSKGIDVTTEGADMYIGDLSDGWFPMYWHFSSREHALSLSASQACGGDTGGQLRAFCNNVNGEEVFRRAPDLSEAFERFKEGFCKTTLITLYLNNFSRKALIRGEGGKAIGVFEDGLRTYLEDGEVDVDVIAAFDFMK